MNRWNEIFHNPNEYHYYDLLQPHQAMPEVSKFFRSENISSVLDVGCGLGNNLFFLAKQGFQLTGLDYSLNAITQVNQQLARDNSLQAKAIKASFESLPFAAETFDAAISIQALHHGYTADVQQGIAELYRVMKTGGYFFVSLPSSQAHGIERYALVTTAIQVEAHTYIPTLGKEVGVPHHIFTPQLIEEYFVQFELTKLWQDNRDYYCVLGKKK